MKKSREANPRDDLRTEYEFDYSKAVRGKYTRRLKKEESNVVVLEPDVAEAFRDSAAVNDALRSLLQLARSTQRGIKRAGRQTKRPGRRATKQARQAP